MIDPLEPAGEPMPAGPLSPEQHPAAAPARQVVPAGAPSRPAGPTVIPLAQPDAWAAAPAPAPEGGAGRPLFTPAPLASDRCPNCLALVPAGAATCPTCGESLREKPQTVRCRQCGKTAAAALTICPHCGRELQSAPSRWLTIGLPVALAIVLFGLIALQSEGNNPFRWFGDRVRNAAAWVGDLSARLDPQMVVIEPAQVSSAVGSFAVGEAAGLSAGVPPTDTLTTSAEQPLDAGLTNATGAEPAVAGGPATAPEVIAVVTEPAAAPTLAPTLTPIQAPTEAPTAPPTATPMPTPAPQATASSVEYTVQQGDTALGISGRFGVDVATLLAANSLTEAQAALMQPGQKLRIPLASASGPQGGSVYTVRAGDTLVAISVALDVPMETIMQANSLTALEAASLTPGETLVIPAPTATPGPTPTPTAMPTATPALPPAATLAPAAAPAGTLGMRLPVPRLRGPLDGVTIRCDTAGRLLWEPVSGIQASDLYRVHLGFIGGRDDAGNSRPTWLIQQDVPATVTQVNVDRSLCAQAPAEFGNQWRWYVEVVAPAGVGGANLPVSPPSDVWGFVWN